MPFSHDCHNQLSLGKSIDDALRLGCRTAGYRQSPGLRCGRNQGVIGAAVVTPVSIFIGPLRHLHGINRIVRKGRHYDCHAGRPAAVAANVVSSVGLAGIAFIQLVIVHHRCHTIGKGYIPKRGPLPPPPAVALTMTG